MKGVVNRFDTRAQVALLALLALYFLIWPLWRAQFPIEIAQNEGWNAYHADAAVGGGVLYPSPDTLIVNNYPPLSFYALGFLGRIFGDPLFVGRVLSLLATIGLGALIAKVVLQLGGGRAAAAIAGLWFVATMARSYGRFVGMNDPQLAGQFVMVAALAWFLARDKAGKSAEPAILLMVLAGFWKHNIVAIPATVLVWLLLRDGRRAVRPLAVGIAAAVFGLAVCIAVYGDVFLANLLTPRPSRLMRALGGIGRSQWILPALVLWALWAWGERKTFAARFTGLHIGIAFAVFRRAVDRRGHPRQCPVRSRDRDRDRPRRRLRSRRRDRLRAAFRRRFHPRRDHPDSDGAAGCDAADRAVPDHCRPRLPGRIPRPRAGRPRGGGARRHDSRSGRLRLQGHLPDGGQAIRL